MARHNPFRMFRKNQKAWLAGLTLFTMFSFIALGSLFQCLQTVAPQRVEQQNYATTKTVGNLDFLGFSQEQQSVMALQQFLGAAINKLYNDKVIQAYYGSMLFVMRTDPVTNEQRPELLGQLMLLMQMLSAASADSQNIVDRWLVTQLGYKRGYAANENDVKAYLALLFANTMTPEDLAFALAQSGLNQHILVQLLANEIVYERMVRAASGGALGELGTSPADALSAAEWLGTKLKASVASFQVDDYLDQVPEPTEETLRAYYEKYKNILDDPSSKLSGFRLPTSASFEVIRGQLTEERLAAVTDEEIEAYYNEHKSDYAKPQMPTANENATSGPIPGVMTEENPLALPEDLDTPVEDTPAEEPAAEEPATEEPAAEETSSTEQTNPFRQVAYLTEGEDTAQTAPAEEPVAEEATADAPAEEPAVEEATTAAPAEEPVAEEATADAPAEESVAEEAPADAPAEEPVAEEATADAPAEETASEEATADTPAEENAAEEATADAPAEETVAEEATTAAPAEEPAVEETAPAADEEYYPLDEVRDEIRRKIAAEKLSAEMEPLFEKMKDYGSARSKKLANVSGSNEPLEDLNLEALANEAGLSFSATISEKEDGTKEAVMIDARQAAKSDILPLSAFENFFGSTPWEYSAEKTELIGDSIYLYWANEVSSEHIPEFEEALPLVVRSWKKSVAIDLAEADAIAFAARVESEQKSLEDLAAADGENAKYRFVKTESFTGFEFPRGFRNPSLSLGQIREEGIPYGEADKNQWIVAPGYKFYETAYGLELNGVATVRNQPEDRVFVLQIIERDSDEALLEQAKDMTNDSIASQALSTWRQLKASQFQTQWMEQLRNEAGFEWVSYPNAQRGE